MVVNTHLEFSSLPDFLGYIGRGKDQLDYFMIEDDKFKEDKDKWFLHGHQINMARFHEETTHILQRSDKMKAAIFIFPNGAVSDRYVKEISWHFVDIDEGCKDEMWLRIMNSPLPPTFAYKGRAGYKLLFRVTDAHWDVSTEVELRKSIAHFKNVQQQLIDFYGGDGAVISPSNALRPPFVKNFKLWREGIVAVEELVQYNPDAVYTQKQLIEVFPPATSKKHTPQALDEQYTPEETAPALNEYVNCLHEIGLDWTDRGDRISFQCPFHDDSSASAFMYKSNLILHCSAGANGNCDVGSGMSLLEASEELEWADLAQLLRDLEKTKYEKYQSIDLLSMSAGEVIPLETLVVQETSVTDDAVQAFTSEMLSREQYVSMITSLIIHAISELALNSSSQVTCIPLPPGGGKSTWMTLLLVLQLTTNLFNAGAIIIVERIEQARELQKKLGQYSVLRHGPGIDVSGSEQHHAAYVMESAYTSEKCKRDIPEYRYGICRGCPDRTNCSIFRKYTEQVKYPIVIITHTRLKMDGDNLEKYRFWVDANGKEHRRELIIIDEKPPIAETYAISLLPIVEMKQQLCQMANENQFNIDDALEKLKKVEELLVLPQMKNGHLEPIDPNFSFAFKSSWYKFYHGDRVEILDWVERFIRSGGIYNNDNKQMGSIVISRRNTLNFEGFRTIILDGTGAVDMEFGGLEDTKFLEVPTTRSYNNLNFYVHKQPFGKQAVKQDPGLIESMVDEIRKIAEQDQTLVLCYKEQRTLLEERLKYEIHAGRVHVNHFGNVKGSNAYNECTALVLLGSYHKGEAHYLSLGWALSGELPHTVVNPIRGVRRFHDRYVEKLKLNDQLVNIVQDVCRVAIRNRTFDGQVKVYFPTRDELLVRLLQEFFSGSSVLRWDVADAGASMPSWYEPIDALLRNAESGAEFSKKELRECGRIGERNFRNIEKQDVFIELLQKHGVIAVNTKKYCKE